MKKFRNESYITQRFNKKSKIWNFQVRVPNAKAKLFSESVYGTSKLAFDEAIKYRNKCLINSSTAQKINQANVPLEQVFDESYAILPVREETKRKQIYHFKKYIAMNKPINEIKRSDIVLSLNNMIVSCSDDTIEHVLSIWKRIFKTALIKEYVLIDLTQGVIKPHSQYIPKQKKNVITTRETLEKVEGSIYKSFDEKEAKSVVMALETMWYTGMRPAECFALSPNDFKGGYISVSKELGSSLAESGGIDNDKLQTIRACKTDSSIRRIPIPLKLFDKLKNYDGNSKDVMFPNKHGDYFYMRTLQNKIHLLGYDFNMYQLRHTLATKLIIDMGADQRTVQEILGHSSYNMSVYYSRSNEDKKIDVLNSI